MKKTPINKIVPVRGLSHRQDVIVRYLAAYDVLKPNHYGEDWEEELRRSEEAYMTLLGDQDGAWLAFLRHESRSDPDLPKRLFGAVERWLSHECYRHRIALIWKLTVDWDEFSKQTQSAEAEEV